MREEEGRETKAGCRKSDVGFLAESRERRAEGIGHSALLRTKSNNESCLKRPNRFVLLISSTFNNLTGNLLAKPVRSQSI